MTFDARTLMVVIRKGPAYELIVDAITRDPSPRVCATSLAELVLQLDANGDHFPALTVKSLVRHLELTVVPFTDSDWDEVLNALARVEGDKNSRPSLGQLLAAATAIRTGASLYTTERAPGP